MMQLSAKQISTPPIYPMVCPLCGYTIVSDADRKWHGLGECAEICDLCNGVGEVADSQCPPCLGTGAEKSVRL